jgi:sporulation protein YlmC with PRC-barrel domain
MRSPLLAVSALAIAFAATPAMSQHQQRPPAGKAHRALVGLAIFTSDGKEIGKVLATGIDKDDQFVLIAEIERLLGIGSLAVAIPTHMFVRKSNRIELTITEAEISDTLSRAERKR